MSLSIKEKVKAITKLLFEPKVFYKFISFRAFGYIMETGWLPSFKSGKPVDFNLEPIPWFTYAAIDFLKGKLNKNLSVLELGSGNSTFFFSERVADITSLEHSKEWYQEILNKIPSNVELIFTGSNTAEEYLKPISKTDKKFDIIIIDSIFRNECLVECLNYLTDQGIIIFDDTERNEYLEGIEFAVKEGFKKLDFSGIAPGIFFRKCTTIFYKEDNCFNI